jgi:vitamin B12 transporter
VRTAAFVLLLSLAALEAQAQTSQQPLHSAKETVVVLGNVEPVSLGDSSRTVVAIDTQEHALAFQDVEDYLRTDASVDIQQRAAAGVMADISLRGASFEQTLVLLNGLRWSDGHLSPGQPGCLISSIPRWLQRRIASLVSYVSIG